MNHPGWILVIIGAIIVAIGLIWVFAPSIPWLGRLPGDIRIEGEKTRVYIPITTCILISLLLSAIVWIVRQFFR